MFSGWTWGVGVWMCAVYRTFVVALVFSIYTRRLYYIFEWLNKWTHIREQLRTTERFATYTRIVGKFSIGMQTQNMIVCITSTTTGFDIDITIRWECQALLVTVRDCSIFNETKEGNDYDCREHAVAISIFYLKSNCSYSAWHNGTRHVRHVTYFMALSRAHCKRAVF